MLCKLPRVFVTGAGGFIGRHLCDRLSERGFAVTRGVRRLPKAATVGEWSVTGDLAGCDDLADRLKGHDVVVHLAGSAHIDEGSSDAISRLQRGNVEATERLARAAVAAKVDRLVLISSIGVLGERSDQPLTERDPPAPVSRYAASKLQAELIVQRTAESDGIEPVIVRPALVYGPRCPGNLARLMRLLSAGVPLPFAGVTARRSLIAATNLCGLIERAIIHRAAGGQTFLAADGEDVTLPELLTHLAAGLDVRLRLVRLPPFLLGLAARAVGRSADLDKLTSTLLVDASKAKTLLGWLPELSVAEGLRAAACSFRH